MKIHVFSIMHNEERLLTYFLRHYSTFADKIFIFDDDSTDRTAEIAKKNPKVQIFHFPNPTPGKNNEGAMNKCFVESYKKFSRGIADWVMFVDGDEFIYHKDIVNVFEKAKKDGENVLKTTAYSMISEKFPTTEGQIYEECCYGIRNVDQDKSVIINPEIDIDYFQARHFIIMPPGIHWQRVGLLFLHFQHISKEYFIERYTHSFPRRNYTSKGAAFRMRKGLAFFDRKPLIKII